MRVSERQRYLSSETRVERAKNNNGKMLEKISSQKRINRVSDDPVGMSYAIKQKAQIAGYEQYSKNMTFAKGYLERSETSLRGIQDYLIRAKELAVGMANATYDEESRQVTALEIREIIDGVVSLANSSYGNRYVFGGFRTTTPPLTNDGHYAGDDGVIFLQVNNNKFRQVNVQARGLFEADADEREKGHVGMISNLENLYSALDSNSIPDVRKAMHELEYQMDKNISYQATLGSIHNGISETERRVEISNDLSKGELSKTEDVDMFKASSDFKQTEAILQSTLMASNKLLQPSLMNFLQ